MEQKSPKQGKKESSSSETTSHVKQANGSSWVEAPVGSALPFEYDNHYYLDDKP